MDKYINIVDNPNLSRDSNSFAIINTDNSKYERAIETYNNLRVEKKRMFTMENDIKEIKNLLSTLINNIHGK